MSLNKFSSSNFATPNNWMKINCDVIKANSFDIGTAVVTGDLLVSGKTVTNQFDIPNSVKGNILVYDDVKNDYIQSYNNRAYVIGQIPPVVNSATGYILPEDNGVSIGAFEIEPIDVGTSYHIHFYGNMINGTATTFQLILLMDTSEILAETNIINIPVQAVQTPFDADIHLTFRTIGVTGSVASIFKFTKALDPPPLAATLTDMNVFDTAAVSTAVATKKLSIRVAYGTPAANNSIYIAGCNLRKTSY